MRTADVGERELIQFFTRGAHAHENVVGFADDCAAIPSGDDWLVLTTDALQRHTHFPDAMRPADVGAMAAQVNLSDLAAMGATPVGALLAAGLPPDLPLEAVDGIARGFRQALDEAGAELLGGDTKPNPTLTLAVTAVGRAPREELLRRDAARPGDVLLVTGALGGAAAGLEALRAGRPEGAERLLRPRARLAEGRALAAGGAHACTDLSDGLLVGAHLTCDASGVGVEVDARRVPVAQEARRVDAARARAWALGGAGDYELLATAAPADVPGLVRAVEAAGGSLTPIGRIVPANEGRHLVDEDGRHPLPREGWEHFRDGP